MKRREFLEKAGCSIAGFAAAPAILNAEEVQSGRHRYKIEVEIFETPENSPCHQKGEKYNYPDDIGKVCPWLRSSMHDFMRLLEEGVTLGWKYEGSPYEKVIDPEGITTEYVRCPDPVTPIVAKIIRTRVG